MVTLLLLALHLPGRCSGGTLPGGLRHIQRTKKEGDWFYLIVYLVFSAAGSLLVSKLKQLSILLKSEC